MAFDLSSIGGVKARKRPIFALVYGPPGVGKTTFPAFAPSPIYLPTEDGTESLRILPFDVPSFPVAKTFEDVASALYTLVSQDHDFQTLVVDSVDWLEPLVEAETCVRNGWKSIEEPGYGKGYIEAVNLWLRLLDGFDSLRTERGMNVVLLGHSMIKSYASPDADPFDRYMLKLQAKAGAKVMEAVDMVLFANYKTYTTETDTGFKKKVRRGVGSGERVIYTEERPAFMAKNRHSLPPELPLSWDALADAIAGRTASKAPVASDTNQENQTDERK